MFKKILTQLLVVLSLAFPATAVEVDLTEFASGNASTHTHVYTDKYDSSYHWKECELCKNITNKEAHTLSTRYTQGDGNCASTNKKLTSCSVSTCSYSVQVAANFPHGRTVYSTNGTNTTNYKVDPRVPMYKVCYM